MTHAAGRSEPMTTLSTDVVQAAQLMVFALDDRHLPVLDECLRYTLDNWAPQVAANVEELRCCSRSDILTSLQTKKT